MATARHIASILLEEGSKARSHYQVWWALRNRALPKYHATMNQADHVDFFHAANSGHYTLFLLSLAKLFDRDTRVAGFKDLKRALRAEGKTLVAVDLAKTLKPHEATIKRVMAIRSRTLVHNEHGISREKVYALNGVTPNQLRSLIDASCTAINDVANAIEISNQIFDGTRLEEATLSMLQTLSKRQQ